MNKRNIICNNCGKCGHISINCKEPITSYGLIIFKKDKNDKKDIKLLMINKKDSLCYVDFIKGRYDTNNVNYIQILIDKFSNEEKDNILKNDFNTLWKNLWLVKDIKKDKEYIKCKTKFYKLKNGYYNENLKLKINLSYFVTNSKTNYDSSEWEFPKGKKKINEKNINCAIRECYEETNYSKNDYNIIINIEKFSELYFGENKIQYRHIYYLAELNNFDKDISNKIISQNIEVKRIDWLNKEDCLSKLRVYQKSRENVINSVYNILNNLEDYIII